MGNTTLKNIGHCKKCGNFISKKKQEHRCAPRKQCIKCGKFIGNQEHKCKYKMFKLNLDLERIKRLHLNENKSCAEIARILKVDVSTINSRLEYAKINRIKHKRIVDEDFKKKIIELYNEKKSMLEISKILCCKNTTVKKILDKKNVPIRKSEFYFKGRPLSKQHINNVKEGIEKRRKKLGYINSPKARKKLSNTRKRLIREGKLNPHKGMVVRPNKPEKLMISLIKENNLPFNYVGNGQIWVGGFNPDFLSKNPKHIIEVFGDYWHNLPKVKKRDKRRFRSYKEYGYKTLIIWEHELTNNRYGKVLSNKEIINKIRDFIN